MTWDQVQVWLIMPAIVAVALAGGGIWLSRHLP